MEYSITKKKTTQEEEEEKCLWEWQVIEYRQRKKNEMAGHHKRQKIDNINSEAREREKWEF